MSAIFGPNTVRDSVRYYILEGSTAEALAATVSEWIAEGWKTQGGIAVGIYEVSYPGEASHSEAVFYQAVSR